MVSPRLRQFLKASLCAGLLGFSGCRSTPTSSSFTIEFEEVTRTPEEARVYRSHVRLVTDAPYGYTLTWLVFTEPGGKEHKLYLHDKEALRLGGLAPEKPVEIRLLVHQETDGIKGSDRRREREDLEAVIADGVALVDRSVCALHQTRMTRQSVPIHYGLPSQEFFEASNAFPSAAFALGGCCVINFSPKTEYSHVCPVCQNAYQAWRRTVVPAGP